MTFSSFCDAESFGLWSAAEAVNAKFIWSITFGAGANQYSTATPATFGFTTTFSQRTVGPMVEGPFSFVNEIPADYTQWLAGGLDHSVDAGADGSKGYMMLVAPDGSLTEVFRIPLHNLYIGAHYEFSAYVANVIKKGYNLINPNIRFEVRTGTSDNTLIAAISSGDVAESDSLTWSQYGMSFYAPTTSIVLLLIQNGPGGPGNDFVLDDITLRMSASSAGAIGPPRESSVGLDSE